MRVPFLLLAAALPLATGCAEQSAAGDGPKEATSEESGSGPASAPSSRPGSVTSPSAARADPSADAEYVADGKQIPGRVGARRVFLQQGKVTLIRDPLVLPNGKDLVVVAKAGGVLGLFKMPLDGSAKAELFQPVPRYDSAAPKSASNRTNWFIGTPRAFPDGEHVIFDGSTPNPYQQHSNVLGIASTQGGVVSAVVAKGAQLARTPDVHPDGKTVIFSACDELRIGQLEGHGDQELETTVLLQLPRPESAKESVCTMHRPRFSRDGKRVAFEVLGRHLPVELREKYKVPEPLNESDGLIEPWIMNVDGTGVRRLVSDEAYTALGGRLQAGGSKEPEFSPDGESVVFSHGRSIALVSVDGKRGRIIATSNVAGDGNTAVQFLESDPSFSPDGKHVVSASGILSSQRLAPPGITLVDLAAADATPKEP